MSHNLHIIIEHINDHFCFGSTVDSEIFDRLIVSNPINSDEIDIVYQELSELQIKIYYSKSQLNNRMDNLLSNLGTNKTIKQTLVKEIFYKSKIYPDIYNLYLDKLESQGISIVEDDYVDNSQFDCEFLDCYETNSLDDILDNEDFRRQVNELKEVATKSSNNEYLHLLNNSDDNSLEHINALQNIVEANSKLVWKVVRKYSNLSTISFDCNDMYQEGMLGLIKAAERFDLSLGCQFSTYAIWWINQAITRSIANYSTTIRIPVHMREKLFLLIREENNFFNEHDRCAKDSEIAELMDLKESEIYELKTYKSLANLTSLETSVGENEDSQLYEFIADEKIKSPEQNYDEISLREEIMKTMRNKLKQREQEVLIMRFGLVDGRAMTLEEVGEVYNLTRERIRQIEAKALRKLKHPFTSKDLKEHLYD